MNRRTDAIRSMFALPPDGPLSADNKTAPPRVASGAVRSLKDTFSGVEQENEELRARLSAGRVALDIDPNLIDPSPLADRFDEQEVAPFEALKASILERGQEIPILVREHLQIHGRYQCAYGHRRVRAAKDLGIAVKAYVRTLSDEELIVAQGLENSAREDLSFIERAVFAAKLEDAGFQRSIVQAALSVDRAEVSKLVAVARGIPADIIRAIGPAPKIGRGRWQTLAEAMAASSARKRAQSAIKDEKFAALSSDARFVALFAVSGSKDNPKSAPQLISTASGAEIARVSSNETQVKLTMNRVAHEGFATFLVAKLPELFDNYLRTTMDQHGAA